MCVSSSQTASSYIIRNPQPRRSSQSQPVRGRDEEQDDIVSADVEEVKSLTRKVTYQWGGAKIKVLGVIRVAVSLIRISVYF